MSDAMSHPAAERKTAVTDDMVELAWAAIVGADVAPNCFNASIIRADLKDALEAVMPRPSFPAGIAKPWEAIDTELSAYVQTIRTELIEECAKIAAQEPPTHAERCIAAPYAVRQNCADRIRALATACSFPSTQRGDRS